MFQSLEMCSNYKPFASNEASTLLHGVLKLEVHMSVKMSGLLMCSKRLLLECYYIVQFETRRSGKSKGKNRD
jgi:hypothetical protein